MKRQFDHCWNRVSLRGHLFFLLNIFLTSSTVVLAPAAPVHVSPRSDTNSWAGGFLLLPPAHPAPHSQF